VCGGTAHDFDVGLLMPVKDIEKASPEKLKEAYEQDYKTEAERRAHVHTQVIKIVDKTETIGGISYPVIDLTTLIAKGCKKVVDFLLDRFQAAGVRPDTPFHKNEEANTSFRPTDIVMLSTM
jgi:hypothetical protein